MAQRKRTAEPGSPWVTWVDKIGAAAIRRAELFVGPDPNRFFTRVAPRHQLQVGVQDEDEEEKVAEREEADNLDSVLVVCGAASGAFAPSSPTSGTGSIELAPYYDCSQRRPEHWPWGGGGWRTNVVASRFLRSVSFHKHLDAQTPQHLALQLPSGCRALSEKHALVWSELRTLRVAWGIGPVGGFSALPPSPVFRAFHAPRLHTLELEVNELNAAAVGELSHATLAALRDVTLRMCTDLSPSQIVHDVDLGWMPVTLPRLKLATLNGYRPRLRFVSLPGGLQELAVNGCVTVIRAGEAQRRCALPNLRRLVAPPQVLRALDAPALQEVVWDADGAGPGARKCEGDEPEEDEDT